MKITAKHRAAAHEILKTLGKQPANVADDLAFGASFTVELATLVEIGAVTAVNEEGESFLDLDSWNREVEKVYEAHRAHGWNDAYRVYGLRYVCLPGSVYAALRDEERAAS